MRIVAIAWMSLKGIRPTRIERVPSRVTSEDGGAQLDQYWKLQGRE
jgi:hypothetical protein